MGYELNSSGYEIFIKIEVGIREYLISIIKKEGIADWFATFLGIQQRESINETIIRIKKLKSSNYEILIQDLYIEKLYRAKKVNQNLAPVAKMYHPFYYLNWTDMEALLKLKSNSVMIDKSIGKNNRELLISNLYVLKDIRNDIAHSRFISENDFNILNGAFIQINSIVPNFNEFFNNQSVESCISEIIDDLILFINIVTTSEMMTIDEIREFIEVVDLSLDSFWVNTFLPKIIKELKSIKGLLKNYMEYRKKPGGLLQIQKWKKNNSELIYNLKNSLNAGKI